MKNDVRRRDFLALAGAAAALLPIGKLVGAPGGSSEAKPTSDGTTVPFRPETSVKYRPVITPNAPSLPWKVIDGVKIFHLIAEPVRHEFTPGLIADCWGYNGRVHGPTIEAVEGDRIRIYVTNRLPEATTVHWHGVLVPSGMDGVGGLSQKPIEPGGTFKYEFTLRQHGTFMYHPHHDEMTQMQLGMMGLLIIHPQEAETAPPDRDYAILLSEWKIEVGARRPDPNEMTDFNVFTMNARSFPGTEALVAQRGERVRIRIGNLSTMSHHSIHLHGASFTVVATDGGPIQKSAQWNENSVFVPTGTTRTIEFIAATPGDWVMHCHMLHHAMNQMGHGSGNLIGVDTKGLNHSVRTLVPGYMTMGDDGAAAAGEMGMPVPPNSVPMAGAPGPLGYITMGGMFTILKVREHLTSRADPGWYQPPPDECAEPAKREELERDGIG